MADDKPNDEQKPIKDISSDSGLGNLPPLSDFDSQGGLGSDGGLPPLGSFDSESVGTPSDSDSDLPAISDIDVETPNPTGGSSGGFGSNVNDTFSSGSPLDTPSAGSQAGGAASGGGAGFQDLAADSDFSPETPEIGPGPDSNVDTPMFDSAFGGGDAGFNAGVDTPSPTQAMETPMFGGGGAPDAGGGGFDPGGFSGMGGGGGGFDAGTPPPDFSPDTDVQAMATTGAGAAPPPKRGGGAAIAIAAVVALLIGLIAGPYIESFLPIPTPLKGEVAQLTQEKASLTQRLATAEDLKGKGVDQVSPEQLDKLRADLAQVTEELSSKQPELDRLTQEVNAATSELETVQEDLSLATEEYLDAQKVFEDLQNETAIIQARQRGLIAEVDRLTGHVGELEDANERRIASKQALGHAIDRLYVQVSEGIPLTPEKYNHAERVASVEALRDRLSETNWVTPALMDSYTDLYLKELAVAAGEEYFFARLAVKDQFGNTVRKWAECLMRGNWAVYYRTLDGKNIGIYKNLSDAETPRWGYTEDFPERTRKEIEDMVFNARVEGFEEKVIALAEKEMASELDTPWQKAYSSL